MTPKFIGLVSMILLYVGLIAGCSWMSGHLQGDVDFGTEQREECEEKDCLT